MKKQKASSFFLASPKKKSKLDTMFEQLESSNAAFLSAAAAQSMAVQLAHVKASRLPRISRRPFAPAPLGRV